MTIRNLPSIKTHFRIEAQIYNNPTDRNLHFSNPGDVVEERCAGQTTVIDYQGAGQPLPLQNDVEVYLEHQSAKGKQDRTISRFRFNTSFIHKKPRMQGISFNRMSLNFNLFLLDPVKIHSDPKYKDFSVEMVFSEVCKKQDCAATVNVNDTLPKEPLAAYNLANLCSDCIDAPGDSFHEWVKI